MKRILFTIVLGAFAFAAQAGGVVRDAAGNTLTLRDTACTHADVVKHIPADMLGRFKAAALNYEGKDYAACWGEPFDERGVVLVVDETGDVFPVSKDKIELDSQT